MSAHLDNGVRLAVVGGRSGEALASLPLLHQVLGGAVEAAGVGLEERNQVLRPGREQGEAAHAGAVWGKGSYGRDQWAESGAGTWGRQGAMGTQ